MKRPAIPAPIERVTLMRLAALLALAALVGCSTRTDLANPTALDCAELNSAVLATSKEISTAAGNRGRIRNFPLPRFLVSRGEDAQDALASRQTRRIEATRDGQNRLIAERRGRCG